MPLAPAEAKEFAQRWFAAWNSHKMDAIIDCYDATIEHSSPFIKRYNEAIGKGDEHSIKGQAELRGYFQRALDRNPTLRFEPEHIATGLESVILTYRRHSHDTTPTGDLAAEVFFLTSTTPRRIVRSVSHYV
ncbi:MAG: nuclear transport factor 2 family protein [Phycisphaerales bacterium]